MPKLFISYSHDSSHHSGWVLSLAERLRSIGIDATLDQWDLVPGQDLGQFMEAGIHEHDRVLVVCTANYTSKADSGAGGVGYEKQILTAQLTKDLSSTKFLPIVRDNADCLLPRCIAGRLFIDFNDDAVYETSFETLVRTLHSAPARVKPPLGINPYATGERLSSGVETGTGSSTSSSAKRDEVVPAQTLVNEECLHVTKQPSLVFRLPRGFVLIDSLDGQGSPTWGITLNYYDFVDGWRYGTHYHASYRNEWSSERNARKMGIPVADHSYAASALDTAVWIREHSPSLNEIRLHIESWSDAKFLDAGTPILRSTLPQGLSGLRLWTTNHDLRDIESEIGYLIREKPHARTKEMVIDLRLRGLVELQKVLPSDDLGYLHAKEIAAEYSSGMSAVDMIEWLGRFRTILRTAVELGDSGRNPSSRWQ